MLLELNSITVFSMFSMDRLPCWSQTQRTIYTSRNILSRQKQCYALVKNNAVVAGFILCQRSMELLPFLTRVGTTLMKAGRINFFSLSQLVRRQFSISRSRVVVQCESLWFEFSFAGFGLRQGYLWCCSQWFSLKVQVM